MVDRNSINRQIYVKFRLIKPAVKQLITLVNIISLYLDGWLPISEYWDIGNLGYWDITILRNWDIEIFGYWEIV